MSTSLTVDSKVGSEGIRQWCKRSLETAWCKWEVFMAKAKLKDYDTYGTSKKINHQWGHHASSRWSWFSLPWNPPNWFHCMQPLPWPLFSSTLGSHHPHAQDSCAVVSQPRTKGLRKAWAKKDFYPCELIMLISHPPPTFFPSPPSHPTQPPTNKVQPIHVKCISTKWCIQELQIRIFKNKFVFSGFGFGDVHCSPMILQSRIGNSNYLGVCWCVGMEGWVEGERKTKTT